MTEKASQSLGLCQELGLELLPGLVPGLGWVYDCHHSWRAGKRKCVACSLEMQTHLFMPATDAAAALTFTLTLTAAAAIVSCI